MIISKREYPYHRWEPLYFGTQKEPWYSEMLSWEGRQDKMTQAKRDPDSCHMAFRGESISDNSSNSAKYGNDCSNDRFPSDVFEKWSVNSPVTRIDSITFWPRADALNHRVTASQLHSDRQTFGVLFVESTRKRVRPTRPEGRNPVSAVRICEFSLKRTMLELCLQEYRLVVLDGGFLCHAAARPPSKHVSAERANSRRYASILNRLKRKYNNRPQCIVH
ncbi:hypothetical protein EVAR_62439_1 [Eumeta japonica]|uniref:Uncharacterized protein n=1 Tax=Eumeta variegata TaxID=151549 RepID=A0A4C1Z9Y1_EUMVA|nr:hypothetical protein EVAR_62439_1 [Eumeta japonica]